MKIINLITKAVRILGENELLSYLENNDTENAEFDKDRELLLVSYNQTLETVINYCPLIKTETFLSVEGKVKYSNFDSVPYKIISVKPENSLKTYEILPMEIKVDGKVEVTYSYIPIASSLNDEFAYENSNISINAFSFGILAEYLIFKGRYEEAQTFYDKFLNALKNLKFSNKIKKIKPREWF